MHSSIVVLLVLILLAIIATSSRLGCFLISALIIALVATVLGFSTMH